MELMAKLREKAKTSPRKVVFPEGCEERIVRATACAADEGIAHPILLGSKDSISSLASQAGISLTNISIIDPLLSPNLGLYVAEYCRNRDIPEGAALRILKKPLYFGAMMVKMGHADAMVAGLTYATEDVIMASELAIGMQEGISTPSSFFIMDIPGYTGDKGSLLIFADAAVNPDPTSEQLADIAITTARSAGGLLGWEPRVALLSFSTRGSAVHPHVDKVAKAVELIRQREPELLVEGELQADAALNADIARRKMTEVGPVAGRANILIFPDLDAGNIAYKLVQQLAKAAAYGPVLQGFARPVSDLSRGATKEDIIGTTAIMVVRAQAL